MTIGDMSCCASPSRRALARLGVLVLLLGLGSGTARAKVQLYSGDGLTVDGALQLGTGFFASPNANFGLGTYDSGGARRITGSPLWLESYFTPELKASYAQPRLGQFYGDVSTVGAMTLGDGDANLLSTTVGNPASIALENAYVGWKSGRLLGDLGDDALDLRAGRQNFVVGDAFLVGLGNVNVGRRAAYYIGPRTAFDGIGTVRINTEPVRGDLFVLRTTTDRKLTRGFDQPQTDFAGANIEWFESSKGQDGRFSYDARARYVGAMFLHVYDADGNGCFSIANCGFGPPGIDVHANRDGLDVASVRTGGAPFAKLEDFLFYAEYAHEFNDRSGFKVDADAWYVEPGWRFSQLPWTPQISYRYSHFSGDSDPNDQTKRSFDPLFFTTGRGFGTWILGEIAGQYLIFNSNVNVHQVGLSASPRDDLKLSALLYRFDWDQPAQFGGTDAHAMDELDLIAEWTVTERLSITGGFGIARPGKGGRQFLESASAGFSGVPSRDNRTWLLSELLASYRF
jgi:hypothetical protein